MKNTISSVKFCVPLWKMSFLLVGLLWMSGCSKPDDRIEVRYMAWGNPEQLKVEQQLADEFMQQEPGIKVTLFKVPSSAYLQKMTIMMASRTAPDVIRIDHYNFPRYVRQNYFYDLTDFARNDPAFDQPDFYSSALDEGTYNGRLYGLNVLMGGTTLYYNKTAFQNAGLEDPYELYLRGEWTWDKLREDAIRLTKHSADGRPERFGVQIPSFPTYMPIVWAFGGDILTLDAKTCLLDSPEAIRGLQFLADLRWKDHVAPTPSQGALSAFTFESGKIAMVFDWMGMSPRYRDNIRDFAWDICPLPSGPAGNATPLKGNQLVMYRETAHPEAAWKFMRFLTSRETEKVLYGDARRRAIPTRQSVAASPEFLVPNKPPYHVKAFLRPLENGREFPINPRWSEWTTVLTADLDDLWQGREKDAGVVLRRVVPKINAILSSEEGF